VGTGLGGIVGPLLFGHMIATNDRIWVMLAFLIGSAVMALGGLAEIVLGVKAEQTALEDIAKPLTADDAEQADADEGTSREQRHQERERPHRPHHRLGPSPDFYSPGMLGTAGRTRTASPQLLEREVETIAAAIEEAGTLSREELRRRVGARRWGPGRFQDAVSAALDEGRIHRVGPRSYGK
ncbi:MAG: MFS transporter, partial [Actinomycetota bacterium]